MRTGDSRFKQLSRGDVSYSIHLLLMGNRIQGDNNHRGLVHSNCSLNIQRLLLILLSSLAFPSVGGESLGPKVRRRERRRNPTFIKPAWRRLQATSSLIYVVAFIALLKSIPIRG